LGANPVDSWKSEKGFNWIADKTGLQKQFPYARILLYKYESAWRGALKVQQYIDSIAAGLLQLLRDKRPESCSNRPIIFIGHSMGGLVIAKAITLAEVRVKRYWGLLQCISACVFFGTPFEGTVKAELASVVAILGQTVNETVSSTLLELMKPKSEALRELKENFKRIAVQLNPKIEVLCFFEEQPSDTAKEALDKFSTRLGSIRPLLPKSSILVERSSATAVNLELEAVGLKRNHRTLVKFDVDDTNDDTYNLVRAYLKDLVKNSAQIVKSRLKLTRNVDYRLVENIIRKLDAPEVKDKRKVIQRTLQSSSWISKDNAFKKWMSSDALNDEITTQQPGDCLWIKGREGRGKTNSTLAALAQIEGFIKEDEEKKSSKLPVVMAYFFCDSSLEFNSAESILKSFVTQLIRQQDSLAWYAKGFVAKGGNDEDNNFSKKKDTEEENKSQKTPVTIENLWKTIQDMLTDEFIGRRVYFVINNLHHLPENDNLTKVFLQCIKSDITTANKYKGHVPVHWLFTSREAVHVEQILAVPQVQVINLEDDIYEDRVHKELRKHANKKIDDLSKEKKYSKALAYFSSSLIGERAQDTQWIDIISLQLRTLHATENDLKVRRMLDSIPSDLKGLLNYAWKQIFDTNRDDADKIKEMLRTLVLTFEDPTVAELTLLCGLELPEKDKEVQPEVLRLAKTCHPFLHVTDGEKPKICFADIVIKNHLLQKGSQELIGLSKEAIRWQQGVMAWRAFTHINMCFDYEPKVESTTEQPLDQENKDSEAVKADNNESEEEEKEPIKEESKEDIAVVAQNEDDESGSSNGDSSDEPVDEKEKPDPEVEEVKGKALEYAVKHWLHHASRASEIAGNLSQETQFWKRDSRIRRRWMMEHARLTGALKGWEFSTLTALHVAASVGFRQLVKALIKNGHADEVSVYDGLDNVPVRFHFIMAFDDH
jgi:hypothetical protein